MRKRHQKTILLADDDPSVRRLVRRLLEREGYYVLDAASGKEALDVFLAAGRKIDLLVTDVRMPEMSGPALVQHLLTILPSLPVLYISGFSDDNLMRPGLTRFEMLAKPFSPDALRAKVQQLLETSARGAA